MVFLARGDFIFSTRAVARGDFFFITRAVARGDFFFITRAVARGDFFYERLRRYTELARLRRIAVGFPARKLVRTP